MAAWLLTLILAMGVCSLLALRRPFQTRPLAWFTFFLTSLVNEQPFLTTYAVVAAGAVAARDLTAPGALRAAAALAAVAVVGLQAVSLRRALLARTVLSRALYEGLGPGWAREVEAGLLEGARRRPPLVRLLTLPAPWRPPEVELVPDVRYAEGGREHLLDVYRHVSRPERAPVLVYWHGGAFRSGDKRREGHALLHHLASRGWVCVSANYRLRRQADYPANQVDAKRVLAWVRAHGRAYGADPDAVFVAGGSAGAHMAAMCALTQNDPRFQPGFEEADTSVAGAVALYGYFGPYDWRNAASWEPCDPTLPGAPLPTAPLECDARDAPPFVVVHGSHDGVVPAWTARRFVEGVRQRSREPVVYAELPGARHAFDALHSLRTEAVIEAVELFAAWARSRRGRGAARPQAARASVR